MTSDKASNNLSLLKTFQKDYKEKYNQTIYNIECVAHTFNNIVQDILSFIIFSEKDDQLISSVANSTDLEEFDEDDEIEQIKSKYIFFYQIN
jgi:hypothetical protein